METKEIRRFEDMSTVGTLTLYRQEDGDIVVRVRSEDSRSSSVEFCTSGGRSPKTLKALINLFKAMEQDGGE